LTNLCFDVATPAPRRANCSSVNYGRVLRNLLRLMDLTCGESFYEVLPGGVQLWIPAKGFGLHPDVMVVASQPLLDHGRIDRVMNPCLVFEICSGPTPAWDARNGGRSDGSSMFTQCQSIPYLQEYVVIHQQHALIEQFDRRQETVWGLTSHTGFDSVVELNITSARLPLLDVYDRVEFVQTLGKYPY
jgi:Uma2 family endonuclease